MGEPIIMLTTCASQEEAKKISRTLLEKRLIGCANMMPIASMYWWKGKITDEDEVLLIMKTIKEKHDPVSDAIKELHSYGIPLIESVEIEKMDSRYLEWLKGCLDR